MNTPLELVRVVNERFEVVEETARFLSKINEPVGILSIVGLYRTGKSFLLNQLIEASETGFDVAHTVRPGTKGLWIWGNPTQVTNENNEKFRLITIDTEGIGSFSANETQDAQVFALALLLSSFFIYNSLGNIDDNAIQRLGVVTELSKYIYRKRGNENNDLNRNEDEESYEELSQLLPSFLWVVRDFTLGLRNESGKQISSPDYLEMALTENEKNHKNSKNQIKKMLRLCFPDRSCETLIRPVIDEDSIQKLSSHDVGSRPTLRPAFVNQIRRLRRLIHSRIRPKTLGGGTGGVGTMVNGRMFIELLRNYCAAMNTGKVVVDTCWTNVVKSEFDYSYITAKRYYKRKMMEKLKSEGKIIDREPFEKIHLEVESMVMKRFSKTFSFRSSDHHENNNTFRSPSRAMKSPKDHQKHQRTPEKKNMATPSKTFEDHGVSLTLFREQQLYEQQLRKNIQKEKMKIWEGLKKASHQYCSRMIHKSLQKIEKGVSSMSYDSYISFEEDLASLLKHYQAQAKGCERGPVLLATLQKWVLPTIHSIHTSMMNEQSRKEEETKNEILKNHISDMDTLKRDHSSQLERFQKKHKLLQTTQIEHQKQYDELHSKFRDQISKLSQKDLRIQELQRHVQQKEHTIQQNLSKLEKCQVDLSSQKQKFGDFKKQHEDFKRSQEQQENDNYALRMEYDSVRVANESLRQTVEFLDLKNAQLTTSLTQYCDETTKLKFRCENLETTLSGLHDTIRRQNEEISSSEVEKNEIREEMRGTKDQMRKLERETKELEMKRDGLASQTRLASQHIKELQRQIRLEKEKVSDHEGRLRVTLAERDKLVRRSRAAVWERQVEQLNSTNRRILQINKKVMEENKILREEVIKNGGSVRTALLLNSSVLNSLSSSDQSTITSTSTTTTGSQQNQKSTSNDGKKMKKKELSFFSEFIKKDSPHRIIRGDIEPIYHHHHHRHRNMMMNQDPTISTSLSSSSSSNPTTVPINQHQDKSSKGNRITNLHLQTTQKKKKEKSQTPEIKKVIQKQLEEIAKERKRNQKAIENKNNNNNNNPNISNEYEENQVFVSTIKKKSSSSSSNPKHPQKSDVKKNKKIGFITDPKDGDTKVDQQQQQLTSHEHKKLQDQPMIDENSVNIYLDDDDLSTLNYFEEVIRKSRKTQEELNNKQQQQQLLNTPSPQQQQQHNNNNNNNNNTKGKKNKGNKKNKRMRKNIVSPPFRKNNKIGGTHPSSKRRNPLRSRRNGQQQLAQQTQQTAQDENRAIGGPVVTSTATSRRRRRKRVVKQRKLLRV